MTATLSFPCDTSTPDSGTPRRPSPLAVLLAGAFAVLLAASAFGQVIGTTNTLEHVSDYTRMWSLTDPFAFQTVSNLVSSSGNYSNRLSVTGGSSTNQTLVGPLVKDVLSFNTAYAGAASLTNGQVAWDADNSTLAVGLGLQSVLQLGQELTIPVVNRTGAVITNGMVVAYSGTVAASGRILVVPFVANGSMPPDRVLGLVTSDDGSGGISDNAEGKVTWFGKVRGLNTLGTPYGESWSSNGIVLYASTNNPGFLTQYEPQAPYPQVIIGSLAYRHQTQGTVNVRPRWHCGVTDLDDVDGTPLSDSGQLMVWDNARRVFDFTANLYSLATTGSLSSVSNVLASSDASLLAMLVSSTNALGYMTNALASSLSSEAAARASGDTAATNHSLSLYALATNAATAQYALATNLSTVQYVSATNYTRTLVGVASNALAAALSSESVLRALGDTASTNYSDSLYRAITNWLGQTTNSLILVDTAEAVARASGDLASTNYSIYLFNIATNRTATSSNALASAISAELAARAAGDTSLTNYALSLFNTATNRTATSSNALASAISAELAARAAGDASLTNYALSLFNTATNLVRAGDLASTNHVIAATNALGPRITSASNLAYAAYAWAVNGSNVAARALTTSAAASNLAASASSAASNAVVTADMAELAADSAESFASAAYGLASTVYGNSTDAVAKAYAAYVPATNALDLANQALTQDLYPGLLWTTNVLYPGGPAAVPRHATLSVAHNSGAPTATVSLVSWPTNTVWYDHLYPYLTNGYTAATNELLVWGYNNGDTSTIPGSAGIPYPLPYVTNAPVSWTWEHSFFTPPWVDPVTNWHQVTAATNGLGGVTLYWGVTNAFSGFLYATNFATQAAFTNASDFWLSPLVDGVSGSVHFFYRRQTASTSRFDLAYATEVAAIRDIEIEIDGVAGRLSSNRLEFTTSALGLLPSITNVAEYVTAIHSNRTDNPHAVTAAQAGALPLEYAATNQPLRWYASPTNWLEWSGGNTVYAKNVGTTGAWRVYIPEPLTYGGIEHFPATNYLSEIPYPVVEGIWWKIRTSAPAQDVFYLTCSTNLEEQAGYPTSPVWCTPSPFSLPDYRTSFVLEPYGEESGNVYLYYNEVATNTATYYLPTNLVPLETWSYADMTNWMADGNAGQLWATGLADSSASLAINGHKSETQPHAGKYALQTGGAMTNLFVESLTVSNLYVRDGVDFTSNTFVRVPDPVNGQDAATAEWVRQLLQTGAQYYITTNTATDFVFASSGGIRWAVPSTPIAYGVTVVSLAGATNGQYISSAVISNHIPAGATITGPASLRTGMSATESTPGGVLTVEPELYYTYDGTNILGDWSATTAQSVPMGTTNMMDWSFSFPDTTVTNDAWFLMRLKIVNINTKVTSVAFTRGGSDPSFLQLRSPDTGAIGVRGATNLVINGAAQSWNPDTRTLTASVNPVFTNGTSMSDGTLNGTNGVRFTVSGNPTNYWLLFW